MPKIIIQIKDENSNKEMTTEFYLDHKLTDDILSFSPIPPIFEAAIRNVIMALYPGIFLDYAARTEAAAQLIKSMGDKNV